jgi:sortase A
MKPRADRESGVKRLMRLLGTLLILAGAGMLGWALLVWQWQDPFTYLLYKREQSALEERYERRERSFATRAASTRGDTAAVRQSLERAAKRYRTTSRRGDALARLKIARLDLNAVVVNGTDRETLKKGPGRHLATFMPGEGELVYIAGHRTTWGAPFSDIDDLRKGDRVTLELPYATFMYAVTGRRIVRADAVWVLRSKRFEQVALQACWPRFFASHRIIVYAKPIQVTPRGAEPIALARPRSDPGD